MAQAGTAELTVYIRIGCHLCDDMIWSLQQLAGHMPADMPFVVNSVDIDTDAALAQQYGSRIPVLMYDNKVICEYFLDQHALLQALGLSSRDL